MCVCVCMFIYLCVCVCACMHVSAPVCMNDFTHTLTLLSHRHRVDCLFQQYWLTFMHIFWHLSLSLRWFNTRNCASQPQNSKAVTSQCSPICPNVSAVISETCWVFGVHTRWQVSEQQRSAPLFDLGCSSSNIDQTHPHPSLFLFAKRWSQAWTKRGMAGTWKRSDPTAELERGEKGAWKSRGWLTAPKFSGYTRVPRVTCV